MVRVQTQKFRQGSSRALHDKSIQRALYRVMPHFQDGRRAAIEEITPDVWERLREKARDIKTHTIANLDYYLDLLDQSVRSAGGHMHFAKDANEANEIVLSIARQHNVKLVAKTKSMVSEEMGINEVFAQAGIESVETDLGEFIIQLAQEAPFHIIAPVMHKSKEQVSDIFVEKLHSQRHEEIQALCQEARTQLRDKFLRADMGMTGANIVVAQSGTVMLVTNEGNGRMCTSLPKVHVAVAGMEKLVPSLVDLSVFIRLLPRSATGQRITSYMTFITGPRRSSDEDGPEEFHLIVLDNGRSRLLKDPDLRDALNCIRCGACLNACPVFGKVGGHAYGWVYSGPIGAVVTPTLVGLNKSKDLPHASTLCGACRDVCPVKINIPHMLLKLRMKSVSGNPKTERKVSRVERWLIRMWHRAVRSPANFHRAWVLASMFQRPFMKNGYLRRVPFPPFSRWNRQRDFPGVASKSFHQRWQDYLGQSDPPIENS